MRKMEFEELDQLLDMELAFLAKEYGARKNIEPNVLAECTELVKQDFMHYGLAEIRSAYRAWVSGKIGGDKMWGGEFNAAQLGSVLTNYEDYRRNVINAYKAEENRLNREKARVLEQERTQAKYNATFHLMLNEYKQKCTSWQDTPHWLWTQCRKRELIKFDEGEAKQIKLEALEIAKKQIEAEKVAAKFKDPLRSKSIIKEMDGRLEVRACVIAGQITVYRKLLSI